MFAAKIYHINRNFKTYQNDVYYCNSTFKRRGFWNPVNVTIRFASKDNLKENYKRNFFKQFYCDLNISLILSV